MKKTGNGVTAQRMKGIQYRFLQHTADAKFQAYGRTLEEAFKNAALATVSLMWDWKKVEKNLKHFVEVEGRDLPQLLVNFLEELLYLFDSRMFLLGAAENLTIKKKGSGFRLISDFLGDHFSDTYEIFGDVKAITYNEMKIESNDRFLIQVVVDV